MTTNSFFNFSNQQDYFKQFVLIAFISIFGLIIFSLIGSILASVLFETQITQKLTSINLSKNETNALKLIQLFSAVGLFIIPPIIYSKLINHKPYKALGLTTNFSVKTIGITILIMIAASPFLSFTIAINEAVSFPPFLQQVEQLMKQSEQQAKELTKIFLLMNNKFDLFFVFLIVAIVPAIGEELLFRGVLQKLFQQWIKKPHLAIWITAILFSALHMQFYGFFPRMLLGALFGYLFYWSNSLWLPIIAHLFNNGSVVIISYLYPEKINEVELISISEEETTKLIMAMLSLLLTLGLLYFFKNVAVLNNTSSEIEDIK